MVVVVTQCIQCSKDMDHLRLILVVKMIFEGKLPIFSFQFKNLNVFFRRYYGSFPSDQRRPGGIPSGMPPTNLSGKDDSSSSSSSHGPPQSSGPSQSSSQSLQALQQQQKKMHSQSPSQQSKPSNLSKDNDRSKSSNDDKDPPKIKQEGQKPTMETQGPPPPPTSQYFLHPSFTSK